MVTEMLKKAPKTRKDWDPPDLINILHVRFFCTKDNCATFLQLLFGFGERILGKKHFCVKN